MKLLGMQTAKVARVAGREFASTALTKGFIIGALVLPAFFAALMPLIVFLVDAAKPPAQVGVVAIIDRSQEVGPALSESLIALGEEDTPDIPSPDADVAELAGAATALLGDAPRVSVTLEPADADNEVVRQRLLEDAGDDTQRTIAVIDVDADAIRRGADAQPGDAFGSYSVFTRPEIDVRTVGRMRGAIDRTIRDNRYAAAGQNAEELRALTTVQRRDVQEVTESGTRDSNQELKLILPFAVIILLFMGVMTGGQYLLTTTIEEKSSRVIEVLLSATSPMELMLGKILGQLGVGMLLLLMYTGLGIVALIVFSMLDLIAWTTIVYMMIFFLLSYIMIAALMAAVGAAVNELREAQSLMGPIMLVLMLTFYLSFPVSLSPSATWAVIMSMVPPVAPFAMLARIASSEPPPFWQIALSIGTCSVGAWLSVWLAAKVFRVGLLMFGKPPNIRTLLQWVRMA
ncbi:MAG: ABC transporter permease [Planctomycetota bacterium]